jgi:hypothetical protein
MNLGMKIRFINIPVSIVIDSFCRIKMCTYICFQLVSNGLLYLAVNITGIFIHQLTERAQRRAFLDTRDCIDARLDIEEENEKLVSEKVNFLFLPLANIFRMVKSLSCKVSLEIDLNSCLFVGFRPLLYD